MDPTRVRNLDVPLHEPVRLLVVIEATRGALTAVLERNPALRSMVSKGWIQVAVMDPRTQALRVYQNGFFEPYLSQTKPLPVVTSSREWYAAGRDHLEFAEIVPHPAPPA